MSQDHRHVAEAAAPIDPPVPHPLTAGVAWAGLMGLVGVVYLVARSLWQRAIAGVDNVPLASSDQFWSLICLIGGGFAIGVVVATFCRLRHVQTG
jgi:hypothetical protein